MTGDVQEPDSKPQLEDNGARTKRRYPVVDATQTYPCRGTSRQCQLVSEQVTDVKKEENDKSETSSESKDI